MLFNSLEFVIFLPVVFALYWWAVGGSVQLQNALLLVASYVFYGWWDPRFLLLIVGSSIIDYVVGIALLRSSGRATRRAFLIVSLAVNLGLLGVFKYYNFFADSLAEVLLSAGVEVSVLRLNIILPVGISFYTFQTLSYSIDVYRRKLEPTRDFVAFLAYVSFFPQLVAGPIERAERLLPQFLRERRFDYEKAVDGLRQILWGLFKKIVVADNCATFADQVFSGSAEYSSLSLFAGAICFALQIYADFSGYSDVAIGVSRLFGFSLMRNFAFPYFSRDIAEFWRRWHISLSTWFRDYVYIPLGGSQVTTGRMIRNTFAVFVISGLWHGANWTFVVWGALNALYFLPLQLTGRNRKYAYSEGDQPSLFPSLQELAGISTTFLLTVIAWVFFRAESVSHAVSYLQRLASFYAGPRSVHIPIDTGLVIAGFVLVEWCQRGKQHGLDFSGMSVPVSIRWAAYYGVVWIMLLFGGEQQDFIYFQF